MTKRKVDDFRKIYLFLYNLSQFVGFLYIITVLTIEYAKRGPAFMEHSYDLVGTALKFVQAMQVLEILHPLLGYTSGNCIMPFAQVMGRLYILFGMIHSEPRMHNKPVVFYVMYIWSLVEIFRYPYYMLRVFDVDVQLVTWLRYTVWIPLYPSGFICEGIIILRNIPYFEETGRFSVALPNTFNISFYFPTFMRLQLLFGLFPTMYFLMSYMYRQRKRALMREKIQ